MSALSTKSALLDNRKAHKLAPVFLPKRKVYGKKTGPLQFRRSFQDEKTEQEEAAEEAEAKAAANAETFIQKADRLQADLLMEIGTRKAANYRHISRPDLEKFVSEMDKKQEVELDRRIAERAEQITNGLREKFEERRAALNSAGIFHPKANDLRIEAMMLVEMQRSLKLDKLEEHVLDDMLRDDLSRRNAMGGGEVSDFEAKLNKLLRKQPAVAPGLTKGNSKRKNARRSEFAGRFSPGVAHKWRRKLIEEKMTRQREMQAAAAERAHHQQQLQEEEARRAKDNARRDKKRKKRRRRRRRRQREAEDRAEEASRGRAPEPMARGKTTEDMWRSRSPLQARIASGTQARLRARTKTRLAHTAGGHAGLSEPPVDGGRGGIIRYDSSTFLDAPASPTTTTAASPGKRRKGKEKRAGASGFDQFSDSDGSDGGGGSSSDDDDFSDSDLSYSDSDSDGLSDYSSDGSCSGGTTGRSGYSNFSEQSRADSRVSRGSSGGGGGDGSPAAGAAAGHPAGAAAAAPDTSSSVRRRLLGTAGSLKTYDEFTREGSGSGRRAVSVKWGDNRYAAAADMEEHMRSRVLGYGQSVLLVEPARRKAVGESAASAPLPRSLQRMRRAAERGYAEAHAEDVAAHADPSVTAHEPSSSGASGAAGSGGEAKKGGRQQGGADAAASTGDAGGASSDDGGSGGEGEGGQEEEGGSSSGKKGRNTADNARSRRGGRARAGSGDGGSGDSEGLQATVEKVWAMLQVPMVAKLSFSIKYSDPANARSLNDAVPLWLKAAHRVVAREVLLEAMRWLLIKQIDKEEVDRGEVFTFSQIQDLTALDSWLPVEEHMALTPLNWVDQMLALVSDQIPPLMDRLLQEFGDVLSFRGHPYSKAMELPVPGEALSYNSNPFLRRTANLLMRR